MILTQYTYIDNVTRLPIQRDYHRRQESCCTYCIDNTNTQCGGIHSECIGNVSLRPESYVFFLGIITFED